MSRLRCWPDAFVARYGGATPMRILYGVVVLACPPICRPARHPLLVGEALGATELERLSRDLARRFQ